MANNRTNPQLSPVRVARAHALLQYAAWRQTKTGTGPVVSAIIRHFGHESSDWTRHEVDTALNDLVRRGYVRLVPDIFVTKVELLRDTWGGE